MTLTFECAIFIQCIILMHCRPCRSGVAMKFLRQQTQNFSLAHHSPRFLRSSWKWIECSVAFFKSVQTRENAVFQGGYHLRKNDGVSQGEQSPWFWVSNRGEQHPCWQGDSKGNSILLCLGCSEGIEFPFDRKNPKKPAVSWHTTFKESLVCYTFAPVWRRKGAGCAICCAGR